MNWKSTLASFLLFSNLQSPMRANRTTTDNCEGDIIFQLDDEELVAPYLSRFDENICKLSAEQSAFWNRDMLLLGFLLSFGLGVSSKINENGKIASAVNNRADINVKSLPSSYSNVLSTSFVNRINFSNVTTLSDLKTKAEAYWESCGYSVDKKATEICVCIECPNSNKKTEMCYFKPCGFLGPVFALDISEVRNLNNEDKIKLLNGEFPSNCNLKVRDISKEVLETFGKHVEKFLDEIQGSSSNLGNALKLMDYDDRKMNLGDVLNFIEKLEKDKKKEPKEKGLSGLRAFLWVLGFCGEKDTTRLSKSKNVIKLFEHFAAFLPLLFPGHLLPPEYRSYMYLVDTENIIRNKTGYNMYSGPIYHGFTMPLIDCLEGDKVSKIMFCDSFESPCYYDKGINHVPLPTIITGNDGQNSYFRENIDENLAFPAALNNVDRDLGTYKTLYLLLSGVCHSIFGMGNQYLTATCELFSLLANTPLNSMLDLSDKLLKKLEDDSSDLSIALKGAGVDGDLLRTYRVKARTVLNLMNKIFKRNFSDDELDKMLDKIKILDKKQ